MGAARLEAAFYAHSGKTRYRLRPSRASLLLQPPTELPVTSLTAREVYQSLRDAALGIRPLQRLDEQPGAGLMQVDIEGWRLTLDVDGNHLRHCQRCQSPDGREGVFDSWQRTDPVSLLSTWELTQVERLLAELKTAV